MDVKVFLFDRIGTKRSERVLKALLQGGGDMMYLELDLESVLVRLSS